jgi:hypothetical protein
MKSWENSHLKSTKYYVQFCDKNNYVLLKELAQMLLGEIVD